MTETAQNKPLRLGGIIGRLSGYDMPMDFSLMHRFIGALTQSR